MPEPAAAIAAYREWAGQREGLSVFSRPTWLDIVAPGRWRAEAPTDSKGRLLYAWAYVPSAKWGLRWAALPPATPYLGPHLLHAASLQAINPPQECGYALVTTHDPACAWLMGRRCRAMATQVVDLRRRISYDPDLRRLLRRAAEHLTVDPYATDADFEQLRLWLTERPHAGTASNAPIYRDAIAAGLARAWVVRDERGKLQGLAVVPADQRRAYLTVHLRAPDAHPATATMLIDRILDDLAATGCDALDLESGYLTGVRNFNARFGAVPAWYGQARLTRGWAWRAADVSRGLLNRRRL